MEALNDKMYAAQSRKDKQASQQTNIDGLTGVDILTRCFSLIRIARDLPPLLQPPPVALRDHLDTAVLCRRIGQSDAHRYKGRRTHRPVCRILMEAMRGAVIRRLQHQRAAK